jgi:predicted DNA-binding transcriptional regulator AlpA
MTTMSSSPRAPVVTSTGLPADPLLDPTQVAALFKVRRGTIIGWVRQGRFPRPVRIGRVIRWPRQTILELLEVGGPG